MTDEPHVHGPDCLHAEVIGPFTSELVLMVVLTADDLNDGATGLLKTSLPPELVPVVLRALAVKFERQLKAKLS